MSCLDCPVLHHPPPPLPLYAGFSITGEGFDHVSHRTPRISSVFPWKKRPSVCSLQHVAVALKPHDRMRVAAMLATCCLISAADLVEDRLDGDGGETNHVLLIAAVRTW
jgi:hypothetical protein